MTTLGKESLPAYLPSPGELLSIGDVHVGHQSSPFCGPGSLLILGLCPLVAMRALTGELEWHQHGRMTKVTRAEKGTLGDMCLTVTLLISNSIPQRRKKKWIPSGLSMIFPYFSSLPQ